MLRTSLNPCIRRSAGDVTLRSFVAIIAISIALAWAATAQSAAVEPGHSALHAASIGHSNDETCCTTGLDCQCSQATAITTLTGTGSPSTDDAWTLRNWRRFLEILPDNPYHPPRAVLTA